MIRAILCTALLGAGALTFSAAPAAGQSCISQTDRLQAPNIPFLRRFGFSLASSDGWVAIGSPGLQLEGAVFMARRMGGPWGIRSILQCSDPGTNDEFGASVALGIDTLVAGAPDHTHAGSRSGAAYVFERVGCCWFESAELLPAQPEGVTKFGSSLALQDDTLFVGAPFEDHSGFNKAGAVYEYHRQGATWTQVARHVAEKPSMSGRFGRSLAVEGDVMAVTGQQTVHVLQSIGPDWVEVATFGLQAFLGNVVINENRVAVGVFGLDVVHLIEEVGGVWQISTTVPSPGGTGGHQFGKSVDLRGDLLVIGAPGEDLGAMNAGSFYVFAQVAQQWVHVETILPGTQSQGANFGSALRIDDDRVVAGAPAELIDGLHDSGAVYFFDAPLPSVPYCQGKTNSLGCVPFASSQGLASASGATPFAVRAQDLVPGLGGVLLYSHERFNLSFHGATLCVKPPLSRALPVKPAKSNGAPPCSGTLSMDFGARILSGTDPTLSAGRVVYTQWLQRDPGEPTGFNDSLSDALRFAICP